ncbi:hypothetical protein ACJ73_00616 [Blastomyces percursus]|uniref:Uncharacterized protein n=1 Tax=Blastomyces percursus TaxID=1658174 RepID=A0A1J9RHD8_9EURO|nr:hypothetical protein ACJ73_00616 [Blastomyces percursus]
MTLDDLQEHRGLELLAVPDRLGDSIKPIVRYHMASNRAATAMYTPGVPTTEKGKGKGSPRCPMSPRNAVPAADGAVLRSDLISFPSDGMATTRSKTNARNINLRSSRRVAHPTLSRLRRPPASPRPRRRPNPTAPQSQPRTVEDPHSPSSVVVEGGVGSRQNEVMDLPRQSDDDFDHCRRLVHLNGSDTVFDSEEISAINDISDDNWTYHAPIDSRYCDRHGENEYLCAMEPEGVWMSEWNFQNPEAARSKLEELYRDDQQNGPASCLLDVECDIPDLLDHISSVTKRGISDELVVYFVHWRRQWLRSENVGEDGYRSLKQFCL